MERGPWPRQAGGRRGRGLAWAAKAPPRGRRVTWGVGAEGRGAGGGPLNLALASFVFTGCGDLGGSL